MLDLVFTSVVVLSIGGYIVHLKKKSDKTFHMVETTWESNLLSFVERNGLTGVDIEFKDMPKLKTKKMPEIKKKEDIHFIATNIPKGYDFIESTFEKGYFFGPHDHHFSSELIYVIDGKIRVVLCKNTPELCTGCEGTCSLFNETRKDDDLVDIKILNSGDYAFVESGKYHTFEALEHSRCVVITVPPISRGVL